MSLLFVTNTSLRNRKGGWDGLGGMIYDHLKKEAKDIKVMDNLAPPVSIIELFLYRTQKILHIPRIYPAFSASRLRKISEMFQKGLTRTYDHIIFHGSTPWIGINQLYPYSALLDCSFITYIDVYHRGQNFSKAAIKRIRDLERIFFINAQHIYFTSQWALRQTCAEYQLEGKNFIILNQGPSEDFSNYANQSTELRKQFLFIGTDFVGKGGLIIFEAFREFLKGFPDYKWIIVGQSPPNHVIEQPWVEYLGYINKSTAEGREKIARMYAESKANILLSQRDIMPLVIIEGGNAGCPTIASTFAAIPELIEHEKTGWLIKPKADILCDIMTKIARMESFQLQNMRKAVILKMKNEFNWDTIIQKLLSTLPEKVLS